MSLSDEQIKKEILDYSMNNERLFEDNGDVLQVFIDELKNDGLSFLTDDENHVIKNKFFDSDIKSFKDISNEYGLSINEIKKMYESAISKIIFRKRLIMILSNNTLSIYDLYHLIVNMSNETVIRLVKGNMRCLNDFMNIDVNDSRLYGYFNDDQLYEIKMVQDKINELKDESSFDELSLQISNLVSLMKKKQSLENEITSVLNNINKNKKMLSLGLKNKDI